MGDYFLSMSHGANISWVEDFAPKPIAAYVILLKTSTRVLCMIVHCWVHMEFYWCYFYGFVICSSYFFLFLSLDNDFWILIMCYSASLLLFIFWNNVILSYGNLSLVVWHRLVLLITTCPFLCFKIYIVNLFFIWFRSLLVLFFDLPSLFYLSFRLCMVVFMFP